MQPDDELVQRKSVHKTDSKHIHQSEFSMPASEEPKLTLMEEVLLLGLKDNEGYISFWNDAISYGLRACILVELGLRKRIKLEECSGARRRSLLYRKVIVINDDLLDDAVADEALKLIKSEQSETVSNWADYLNGDCWNPFKFKYQMKNVRERLAKNLVEKGVLTTGKKNFLLFDMTIHPFVDRAVKSSLVKKIQDALLKDWRGDPFKMDKRTLALILLADISQVLEDALFNLHNEEYDTAISRVEELRNLNFQKHADDSDDYDVLWAVLTLTCK